MASWRLMRSDSTSLSASFRVRNPLGQDWAVAAPGVGKHGGQVTAAQATSVVNICVSHLFHHEPSS